MIAYLAAALLAPPTAMDLVFVGEIGRLDVAPDGSAVAFSWTRLGDADLWLKPLPQGEARVLVAEPGWEDEPRFSPDGSQIAFVGEGEGEKPDVFVVPVSGGPARNLTAHPATDTSPRWMPDGKSVLFVSDRDGSADLFRLDLESQKTRRLTRNARVVDVQLAGDRVYVCMERPGSGGRVEMRALSERGGKGRRLGPRALRPAGEPTWTPDGSEVAVSMNVEGRLRVAVGSAGRRRLEWLAAPDAADDLRPRFSPRGDAIALVRRTARADRLMVISRSTGDAVAVSPAGGSVGDFAWLPDQTGLVYALERATSPRSLFVGRPTGETSEASVRGASAGLADVRLRQPRRIEIERGSSEPPLGAWLYSPEPERAGRGVVLFRDGPPSVAPDTYSPLAQFLVARHYAVIVPDVPAVVSSTWRRGADALARWRDQRTEDARLAAHWMAREALAAPHRIGAVGEGPVGGHLALAAAAARPEVLRAVVSVGGAADADGLAMAAPWLRKRFGLPPGRRSLPIPSEALEAVMLIHGRLDVLQPAAQKLRSALEAQGAFAPAVVYDGEGAPLRGRHSRVDVLRRIEDFLRRRL